MNELSKTEFVKITIMQSPTSNLQTKLPEIHQIQNKTTATNLFSVSTQAFDLNVFTKALQKYFFERSLFFPPFNLVF